jgi:hypothetical protein
MGRLVMVPMMKLSDVLLQIEIAAEPLLTHRACVRFLFVVGVHMEGQVVHLMECLLADVTLVCLLTRMRESVVFIVALLVEALSAEFTSVWPVRLMYPRVGTKSRAPVVGFSTSSAFVWFFRRVYNLVPA